MLDIIQSRLKVLESPYDNYEFFSFSNPGRLFLKHFLNPEGVFGSIVYEADILLYSMLGERVFSADYYKDARSLDLIKPMFYPTPSEVGDKLTHKLIDSVLNMAIENVFKVDHEKKAAWIDPSWSPKGCDLSDYSTGQAIPLPSLDLILADGLREITAPEGKSSKPKLGASLR